MPSIRGMQWWLGHVISTAAPYLSGAIVAAATLFALSYWLLRSPAWTASRRALNPEITKNSCVTFLRWCLPRLELRWPGYRKVRRLVAKRLNRRLIELGLADISAYRTFLMSSPEEWRRLDAICRIPISRFYRDQTTFGVIARQLLPEAAATAGARGDAAVKCWSAGCASGEEPYTLVLAWHFCVAGDWSASGFTVIATDADKTMIERAEAACYARSSLKICRRSGSIGPSSGAASYFALLQNFARASNSSRKTSAG